MLDAPGTDVPIILKQFGLDKSRVTADLTRSLDRLKSGNARTPSISPTLLTALKEAWNIGSLNYAAGQVRSGFVLLAALTVDELHRLLQDTSREFEKIPVEGLQKEFLTITQMSAETASPLAAADATGAPSAPERARPRTWISTPSTLRKTRATEKSTLSSDGIMKSARSSTF